MQFSLFLDPNVHSKVIIQEGQRYNVVPIDLVLKNEKLFGLSYIHDNKFHPLEAVTLSYAIRSLRPSVKVISPPCFISSESKLVYHKNFSRPIGQLYVDQHGYGSIDAMEINPLSDNGLRKRSIPYLNAKEPYSFWELQIEVDYNGSFVCYGNQFYPIPVVPVAMEEIK